MNDERQSDDLVQRILENVVLRTGVSLNPDDPLVAIAIANDVLREDTERRIEGYFKGTGELLAEAVESMKEEVSSAVSPTLATAAEIVQRGSDLESRVNARLNAIALGVWVAATAIIAGVLGLLLQGAFT